jgi:hypothetical protein
MSEYKLALQLIEEKLKQEKELAPCTFHPNSSRKGSPDSWGSGSPHEFTLRKTSNMSTMRRRSQEEFYKETVEDFLDRKNRKVQKIEEEILKREN